MKPSLSQSWRQQVIQAATAQRSEFCTHRLWQTSLVERMVPNSSDNIFYSNIFMLLSFTINLQVRDLYCFIIINSLGHNHKVRHLALTLAFDSQIFSNRKHWTLSQFEKNLFLDCLPYHILNLQYNTAYLCRTLQRRQSNSPLWSSVLLIPVKWFQSSINPAGGLSPENRLSSLLNKHNYHQFKFKLSSLLFTSVKMNCHHSDCHLMKYEKYISSSQSHARRLCILFLVSITLSLTFVSFMQLLMG